MVSWEAIRQRWEVFGSKLDERGRRLFAAAEARTAGRGGLAAVAEITGLARSTIGRGLKDLDVPGLPGIWSMSGVVGAAKKRLSQNPRLSTT